MVDRNADDAGLLGNQGPEASRDLPLGMLQDSPMYVEKRPLGHFVMVFELPFYQL